MLSRQFGASYWEEQMDIKNATVTPPKKIGKDEKWLQEWLSTRKDMAAR